MLKIFVFLHAGRFRFEKNPKGKINHCTEKRTIKSPVNCFKKMNKEKLIHIILKDIEELKEITEEIVKDGAVTKLETDIALSKATLVVQELQLLKEKYIAGITPPVMKEVVTPILSKQEPVEELEEEPIAHDTFEIVEEEQKPEENEITQQVSAPILILDEEADGEDDDFEENNDDASEEDEEPTEDDDISEEKENDETLEIDNDFNPEEDDISEEEEENDNDSENDSLKEIDDKFDDDDISEDDDNEIQEEDSEEEEEEDDDDDGLEDEEDDLQPETRTVGENFHMGKSLNDMMGNKNNNEDTLDQKFAHGPINSLQSAIGINDRFLFIREIFNNDEQLYSTAIKRLDECRDIRDAVDYLSSNFRIKKTETSLRFVDLIKRRFAK